jgi:hypothetical protein
MARKNTPRGRGPRVRDDELDRMVALYLEGKSFDYIAREVGRHWQTVRKYTIKSLQEREGRELRREALKQALIYHYEDLVRALGAFRELLIMPEIGVYRMALEWQPLAPDRRSGLLLQALRDSHAKESPLWSWWDDWNRAGQSYVAALGALKVRVAAGIKNVEKLCEEDSCTLNDELAEMLYRRAAAAAQGTRLYDPSMLQVRQSAGPPNQACQQELWLGNSTRLAQGRTITRLEEHVSELMDVSEWKEVKELARLYDQMKNIGDKMAEEIEVLSLRRAFPGHCRLCPV